MRFGTLLFAILFPSIAAAAGFGPWNFGMTKSEVRAVPGQGSFYEFRNGDLGTRAADFEGGKVPVSFYFKDDRLVRVMVVIYSGPDFEGARTGWRRAFEHIERNFGAVEIPSVARGPATLASAERALEASGLSERRDVKLQMGAVPMPKDRSVWCTLNIVPSVGYWLALNYAKP